MFKSKQKWNIEVYDWYPRTYRVEPADEIFPVIALAAPILNIEMISMVGNNKSASQSYIASLRPDWGTQNSFPNKNKPVA